MVSAQEVSDDLCIGGLPNGTLIYQWGSLIPHLQNLQWEKALKWQQAVCLVGLKRYGWSSQIGTPTIVKDSALANLNI